METFFKVYQVGKGIDVVICPTHRVVESMSVDHISGTLDVSDLSLRVHHQILKRLNTHQNLCLLLTAFQRRIYPNTHLHKNKREREREREERARER